MIWMLVNSDPPAVFYNNKNVLPFVTGDYLLYKFLISIAPSRNTIKFLDTQDVANQEFFLNNKKRKLTEIWKIPPLRATINIFKKDEEIFEGIITRVTMTNQVTVQVIA